jgi:hypothetical protein
LSAFRATGAGEHQREICMHGGAPQIRL